MPKSSSLSLLKRLTDGASDDLADYHDPLEPLRRDVEALLNTERRFIPLPAELEYLDGSLLDFGVPDFSHLQASDQYAGEKISEAFRQALEAWEPRLTHIAVHPEQSNRQNSTVFLQIVAALTEDQATRVAFETMLRTSDQDVEVKEPR